MDALAIRWTNANTTRLERTGKDGMDRSKNNWFVEIDFHKKDRDRSGKRGR